MHEEKSTILRAIREFPVIEIQDIPKCNQRYPLGIIYLCEIANRTVSREECFNCPYKTGEKNA